MRSKRKATNFPVRWQPYAEVTAAAVASAMACAGEGSLHTPLLGGGRIRDYAVERNLLSLLKGEANQQQQVTNDHRAEPPSLALSLRVGSEEAPQPQNRPIRRSPSLLPVGSGVPPQTYTPTPDSSHAGAWQLVPPQLGNNSSIHQLSLPPPAPEPRCGECSLRYDRLSADLLRRVSEDLDRRMGLLRQELSAEVLRLHLHAAAAAPAAAPLPAAFSAGCAWRWCPACGARPGTVALKPYEHLCLCAPCSDASRACHHCSFFARTGPVQAASASRGRGRGGAHPPWPRP